MSLLKNASRVHTYTFDKEDMELAHYIAEKRNVNEEKLGGNVFVGEKATSYETNLLGAKGEIAVAKYFNVEPDLVFADIGGGAAHDQYDISGCSVEVKTSSYKTASLRVAVQKMRNADRYILCTAHENLVKIIGYATLEEVQRAEILGPSDFCPIPAHTIPQVDLHDMPAKIKRRRQREKAR